MSKKSSSVSDASDVLLHEDMLTDDDGVVVSTNASSDDMGYILTDEDMYAF